ncbi:unnamed protein product [Prunus armeniaca]
MDDEVVFFMDILNLGVQLPLQPPIQRILKHLVYALGQYNPNFWVALMGFSYLYSVTKSKYATHGGWVQANCLQASELGHFIRAMPTSHKLWSNPLVLLSGDWEYLRTGRSVSHPHHFPNSGKSQAGSSAPNVNAPQPLKAHLENQTLFKRLRQLDFISRQAEELAHQQVTGKRAVVVELEAALAPKRAHVSDNPRAVFAAKDEDD